MDYLKSPATAFDKVYTFAPHIYIVNSFKKLPHPSILRPDEAS